MKRKLPVLPPELHDGTLPGGAFSHSQYATYKSCGYSYKFKYVDRVQTPPEGNLVQGISIHSGAEFSLGALMATGKAPELDAGIAAVEASFNAQDGSKYGADKDVAVRMYRLYHQHILPNLKPLAVEEPFQVKFGSVTVQGFIDLVDAPQGVPVVADLKTSTAKWSQNEADTEPQLTLYAAVRGTPFARIDNVVNTKVPAAHQLSTERDAHAVRVLQEDYEETVDFIRRGIFPKAPLDAWKCSKKWCSYWEQCRGRRF